MDAKQLLVIEAEIEDKSRCDYLRIDYDHYIKQEFSEFEIRGKTYLVRNYQLY